MAHEPPGAPDPARWPTALTSVAPNRILVRGYAIDDLIGRVSFGESLYLLLTGELPTSSISRLIDALLVSFLDHGVAPASTVAARQTIRQGAVLNTAVASGILALSQHEGRDIVACRQLLEDGLDMAGSSMLLTSASVDLVEQLVQADRIPPPGFGIREHSADPRVVRLLQVAHELEVDHLYTQFIRGIETALKHHPALADEALLINIDGAIAAVCGDLGLEPHVGEGLAIIARVPGLIGHALEERSRRQTASPADVGAHYYDGPAERRIRDRR